MLASIPAVSPVDRIQKQRFLAACTLGLHVPWFSFDFDADPKAGITIGDNAEICRRDNANRGLDPITPETLERYVVFVQAGGDHQTCLAFTEARLEGIANHAKLLATAEGEGDFMVAVYDLDIQREVVLDTKTVVTVTFPTGRQRAYHEPAPTTGPRVIAKFIPVTRVHDRHIEFDATLEWDATAQIERMGVDAAVGLLDDSAEARALAPPEFLLSNPATDYRIEIAAAIRNYIRLWGVADAA
jgi:hypothetical protein